MENATRSFLAIRHIGGQLEVTSPLSGILTASSQGPSNQTYYLSQPKRPQHSCAMSLCMGHGPDKRPILPAHLSPPKGCLCLPIPGNLPCESCCIVWFVWGLPLIPNSFHPCFPYACALYFYTIIACFVTVSIPSQRQPFCSYPPNKFLAWDLLHGVMHFVVPLTEMQSSFRRDLFSHISEPRIPQPNWGWSVGLN